MKYHRVTPEMRILLKAYLDEGFNQSQIAVKLGVHRSKNTKFSDHECKTRKPRVVPGYDGLTQFLKELKLRKGPLGFTVYFLCAVDIKHLKLLRWRDFIGPRTPTLGPSRPRFILAIKLR